MNRDDRRALVEMAAPFAPHLYKGLDADSANEMIVLALGQTLSYLAALVEESQGWQPSDDDVATWVEQHGIQVERHRVVLEAQPGGRQRQRYSAYVDAAGKRDIQGWRYDSETGWLHLVMSDGKTYRQPYADGGKAWS